MKRYLALALALLMVFGLCSVAGAEENPYAERLTFSINVPVTALCEADPRTALVLEMFNLEVEFVACESSDVQEKSRLWVASGDVPDFMWTSQGVTSIDHTEFIASGLFQPWPSLDNYPNLKAIQDSIGAAVDLSIELNGDRYWYMTEAGMGDYNQLRMQTFYYRTDWAQALGLYHEDHTYTWEEFMEMAIAFGTMDPDGNGVDGDVIGLTSIGNSYPGSFGFLQNAPDYAGFADTGEEYIWGARQDFVIDAIKDLKYLYDNGALWEEQILAAENDGVNKMASGLAGICFNNWHPGQVTILVNGLREVYPDKNVLDIVSPMRVINRDGTFATGLADGYWGCLAISASVEPEVLERFMAMFEYLASEEGFLLSAIGIPGVDWQYDANGEIELLWPADENGKQSDPYAVNAYRFIGLPRLYEGYGIVSPATDPDVRVLCGRANDFNQNALADGTLRVWKTDWNLAMLSTDTAPQYMGLVLSPNVNDKIKEIIISSTAETIEADWLAYLDSCAGQIDPVVDELNQVIYG